MYEDIDVQTQYYSISLIIGENGEYLLINEEKSKLYG